MITVNVDTREFDRTFKQYMSYSKRSFAEACNQHAYYIARDAVLLTTGADKNVIRAKMEGPSASYPSAPLVAILVNSQLGKQGKKGLTGAKMTQAMERFIKKTQSHVNFVKSGWLPAIKILASVVPKKGGSKIPRGTDKAGRNFGGATKATEATFSPIAWIWNSISPTRNKSTVQKIVEEGAQKAMKMETNSMKIYIERKQQEASRKFWGF